VGAGHSDIAAYDFTNASLGGYADDVLEICAELDLTDVVFVGHSVSAMVGGARRGPGTRPVRGPGPHRSVAALSRRHGLHGRLLARRRRRPSGLAGSQLPRLVECEAPAIMGNPERPELGQELTNTIAAIQGFLSPGATALG